MGDVFIFPDHDERSWSAVKLQFGNFLLANGSTLDGVDWTCDGLRDFLQEYNRGAKPITVTPDDDFRDQAAILAFLDKAVRHFTEPLLAAVVVARMELFYALSNRPPPVSPRSLKPKLSLVGGAQSESEGAGANDSDAGATTSSPRQPEEN